MSQNYPHYRDLLERGRFTEAARLAELAYQEGNRGNPFWLTRQAAALTRAGECGQALAIAQKALALQPANPFAVLAAAEALGGLRRHGEALAYYETITLDESHKVSSYARQGMLECLAALGSWDRILELIGIWNLTPAKIHRWRLKAFEGLGRLEEALDCCYRWLKEIPDNPQALWALTDLEVRRDGLEAVLARMAKLAKIPSRPPIYKEIYASLCRRAGKPELALKQYAQIVQTTFDPRIHRQQAFALAKSGQELAAIPLMEELLKLSPKDYYIHNAYIPACRRAKLLDRAMKFYQELLELNPEEKPLYNRLRKLKDIMEEP